MSGERRLARFAAGFVVCAACQRTAPAAAPPRTSHELRKATTPLDARRIQGVELGHSVLLAVEAGIAGDRVSGLLEVPKNDCAIVIARGSSSIEDLDLLAYGEDGTPLGTDEAPDREPSLLICPPHPGRILIAARIAQGHGLVAVGSERVAPALAAKAAARYSVKWRAPGDPARLKAWPGLDQLVNRERARVGGKFTDLRRVALALDASAPTTLPATVDAGHCVHALFIPSDDVSHLDLALLDDHGRVLGRGSASGAQRALVVCSTVTTPVSFEVRPHAGRGLAVAALSRSVAGSEPEIEGEVLRYDVYPAGDARRELAELAARLQKLGYGPPKIEAKVELLVGRRSSTKLRLASGCTRIDVTGENPLRGVSARLWSETGQLWAEASAGSGVALFGCGPGSVRLDTTALLEPGSVTVTTEREPDAPAELSRHPLAGARLISRMLARGVLRRADAIGKLTELELGAQQITPFKAMIPVDRCLDLNVAIEGPASGVELRAVEDNDDALELDSAAGDSAASVRLCGYGRGAQGSLNVRLELRAVNMIAHALVATRLLSPAE